jgi:hypothetical protein
MHLSPGFSVLVAVDGAPYESVVALLDSLERNGVNDVSLMPPFLGTNPSRSVNHWIRLVARDLDCAPATGVCNRGWPGNGENRASGLLKETGGASDGSSGK